LIESTGQYGESTLRRVDLASGDIEQMTALSRTHFGEGIAVAGDRIYQLTWQNGLVLIYDADTFERTGSFRNPGEGWGLTYDGENLIVSDGTSTLRYHDPESFALVRQLNVHDGTSAVRNLNELEFVDGEIWANIWYRDQIARISPETGEVLGWIDLSTLYPRSQRGSEDVLNGIAYDAANDRLFVTGKHWPRLFEITVGPP
ncbi:MAG TPA: glutaminyl-peptide cyclotransferase, partial [Gammaproteobacteria bacterium]